MLTCLSVYRNQGEEGWRVIRQIPMVLFSASPHFSFVFFLGLLCQSKTGLNVSIFASEMNGRKKPNLSGFSSYSLFFFFWFTSVTVYRQTKFIYLLLLLLFFLERKYINETIHPHVWGSCKNTEIYVHKTLTYFSSFSWNRYPILYILRYIQQDFFLKKERLNSLFHFARNGFDCRRCNA